MDQLKTEIRICLGSSCFARGNRKMVQVIQQFIDEHHLTDRVIFHGAHCFGHCGEGPVVSIAGTVYQSVEPDQVRQLLSEHFGDERS